VRQAAEDSLRRLQTDHIDLYQLHQPDPSTPIADTLAAMDELVQSGKVREIGCSNFSAAQIGEAKAAVKDGAARSSASRTVQPPPSRARGRGPRRVRAGGAGLPPLLPLESGLLTGKYRRGQPVPEGTRLSEGERMTGRFRTAPHQEVADRLATSPNDAATPSWSSPSPGWRATG